MRYYKIVDTDETLLVATVLKFLKSEEDMHPKKPVSEGVLGQYFTKRSYFQKRDMRKALKILVEAGIIEEVKK